MDALSWDPRRPGRVAVVVRSNCYVSCVDLGVSAGLCTTAHVCVPACLRPHVLLHAGEGECACARVRESSRGESVPSGSILFMHGGACKSMPGLLHARVRAVRTLGGHCYTCCCKLGPLSHSPVVASPSQRMLAAACTHVKQHACRAVGKRQPAWRPLPAQPCTLPGARLPLICNLSLPLHLLPLASCPASSIPHRSPAT